MTQANIKSDPVVEILRLAYRRGLAICQEQVKGNKETVNVQPLAGETLTAARETSKEEESQP